MMNERTLEHLNNAEDIMTELDPFYDQTPVQLDVPAGFIAQNHCVQFKAIFESLENAVMNLYTQDEEARTKIGKHLLTLKNLQEACINLPANYEQLYGFYKNQLKPISQQIIEFCESNHTELPRTTKVISDNSTSKETADN